MKKTDFIDQLERAAVLAQGTSTLARILGVTAEQLKNGDPPWWRSIAPAWELRRFGFWNEACILYLTALHFEALSDAQSPLALFYPSCGGGSDVDPASGLAKFLDAPPQSFIRNLTTRTPCAYWESMSALWIAPAILFFQRKRSMPFYLVDAEAGAGLTLAADAVADATSFRSELVAARVGLERHSVDPAKTEDRRWLTARVLSGSMESIRGLDAALEALQRMSDETADFIQIVPCPPEKAAEFVSGNIPSDDPGVGVLLLNMFMTRRMGDAEYAAYSASIAKTLEDWGDRGLWVEVENSRDQSNPGVVELRVHRIIGGRLRSHVMARLAPGADKPVYAQASSAFLAVK